MGAGPWKAAAGGAEQGARVPQPRAPPWLPAAPGPRAGKGAGPQGHVTHQSQGGAISGRAGRGRVLLSSRTCPGRRGCRGVRAAGTDGTGGTEGDAGSGAWGAAPCAGGAPGWCLPRREECCRQSRCCKVSAQKPLPVHKRKSKFIRSAEERGTNRELCHVCPKTPQTCAVLIPTPEQIRWG